MKKNIDIYYKAAINLGRVPIIIGTIIFLLWLITHEFLLNLAGAITIFLGFFSVCLGLISLSIYIYKSKVNSIKNSKAKIFKAIAILLINFPLALSFIMISSYIDSTFTIIIDNQSNRTIKNIHVSEFNHVNDLPNVLAHTKVSHHLHFQSEGEINYSLSIDDIKHTGILFGYITSGVHGEAQITINNFIQVTVDSNTTFM